MNSENTSSPQIFYVTRINPSGWFVQNEEELHEAKSADFAVFSWRQI
jgi:hypothetical protein